MTITNFQARFAFTNPDGTLTPEAYRTLRGWFDRIGGFDGLSTDDLNLLMAFTSTPDVSTVLAIEDVKREIPIDVMATVAEMAKTIQALSLKIDSLTDQSANIAEVRKYGNDLDISYGFRSVDLVRNEINDIALRMETIPDYTAALSEIKKLTGTYGTMATQNANAVAITGGTISGVAITTSTYNGNTLTAGSSTYTGTAGQTYTFPTTSATIARIDAANSFTGVQTFGSAPQMNAGANVSGTVAIDSSSNTTNSPLTTRNTSAGNAAVNRAALGNNASATALTVDVYGSNHATKASYVEIFNQSSAILRIGTNNTYAISIDASQAVSTVGSLTAATGFGCNGKTAQTAYTLGAASTDLATVITLANNLRLMSIANGIGQN